MNFFELNEESPKIRQPKGFKIKLKDHQLTSICAMIELEKQGTIVIDRPEFGSDFYHVVKYRVNDVDEFSNSTFILETNSAILADKVGAGKTYTIIGLILTSLIPKTHDKMILGTDHFTIKMITQKESVNVNLIVVPHNLVNQWASFIDKSKLSYLKLNTESDFDIFFDVKYTNTATEIPLVQNGQFVITTEIKKSTRGKKKDGDNKNNVEEKLFQHKIFDPKKIEETMGKYNIFLLNIKRYKYFKQIFKSIKWARVIIDEMDSTVIPPFFDEYGNFNWFLTATPTSIFYKSCRRYVNKIFGHYQHLLNYFVIKNKDEYVDKSMILPKPHVFIINTLLQRVVQAFQDLIPHDVLQLINSGNMKEAVTKLNCNIDTEENIIEVLTDKVKTELHNLEKELEYVSSLIPADPEAHQNRVEMIKKNIKSCETRLESINEKIKSIKDECCFICTEPFDTPAILECCKSIFCLKCLAATLKAGGNGAKCPYCRRPIKSNKDYHIISNKSGKSLSNKKESKNPFNKMDKAEVLECILKYISKNDENPKILIFSDYSQTFEKIIKNISKAGLQYSLLAGTPAHISNIITEFEAGITNVLMLDSQHYGSGLNLQSANYLILYHRMTPELETQVIGRAQRFGRKIPLKLIYLVNDSERKDSNIKSKPTDIIDSNELWMITDPPKNEEDTDEEIINSDEESDLSENKPVIEYKKEKQNINLSEENESSDSDVDELLNTLITKKKSKSKDKKSNNKKSKPKSNSKTSKPNKKNTFQNHTIVFTGFRNKNWEKIIKDKGGKTPGSVSKNTTLLVYKDGDESSNKYKTARKLGIKTMSKSQFSKKYGV
ncbi:NAD-dependent DNA ligase [Saudi moumouvirus]|nr:NAD-dependent DNA ligase [Saudi moumouvirus]